MRRLLSASLTGVLLAGCSGPDAVRFPTEPGAEPLAAASSTTTSNDKSGDTMASDATSVAILNDAIDRLLPALGPSGAALGAPLRQLRSSGGLTAPLVDAAQRQLDALVSHLPAASAPDAEALDVALAALRAAADKGTRALRS